MEIARINLSLATKEAQHTQDRLLTELNEIKADHTPESSEDDLMKRIRGIERSLEAQNKQSVRILEGLQVRLQIELCQLDRVNSIKFFVRVQHDVWELLRQKKEGRLSLEQEEKLDELQSIRRTALDTLLAPRMEM